MKKFLLMALLLLSAVACWAGDCNYTRAADLKPMIESKEDFILIDIQVEDEFSQHHIDGALATYAYPVKSDADKAKLAGMMVSVMETEKPVVIVCPRGGGGAKRTYEFFEGQGVDSGRLSILEGGQQKWPYAQLLAK